MSLKSLLPVLLMASGAAASSIPLDRTARDEIQICGTEDPSEEHKAFSKALLEQEKSIFRKKEPFTVDLHFHVVSASDGNVSVSLTQVSIRRS